MTDDELLSLVARAESAASSAESTLEHVKKYHLKPLEVGKDGGFGFPVNEIRIGSGLSFNASKQIGRLSSVISPEHMQQLSDRVDSLFIVTESDFTSKLSTAMTDSFNRLSSCEASVADIQHRIDAVETSHDSILQRLTSIESQLAKEADMAQSEYAFVSQTGSSVCPATDGEYVTIDMDQGNHREAELSQIRFFSDAECQNQVTPTGGTVQVVGSPDGLVWFTIDNGEFAASAVYDPSRVRPYAQGDMLKAKLILSGVTGAAYFKASMWRA